MATPLQLMVIISLMVITMGAVIETQGLFEVSDGEPNSCTYDNKKGICIEESACDAEHRIWSGGVLDEYTYRINDVCPYGKWCCYNGTIPDIYTTDSQMKGEQTTDTQTTSTQTTDTWTTVRQTTEGYTAADGGDNNSNNCLALETDVCPWCVLLYHSSTSYQNADRPFCLGALIGSKAIITASTCLTTAKNKKIYARLPNSSHPGKIYTILEQISHPNYSTGSHKHDIGLLVMESDVTLQEAQGACLDSVRPLEGFCVGYGFDANWEMYSTFLQVTDSSCGRAGNSTDAACGTNEDAVCLVEFGGPILCPVDSKGPLVLRGIARGICKNDKVTLGGIAPSYRWIEDQLASMDIPGGSYIF